MHRKIYIISNSHMDPIWLWRLREGRSTWLNTCRSVVRMMEKYPFLKFSRSSSACYQWIEEADPGLFRTIGELVKAKRWEPVGGWVEQSDTIITPGESLIRQAEHGKAYFQSRFGRDVRVAYSVDSFGQNAGLPKLLKASGFDYYVWMRPMVHEKAMPDIFRWQSDDGEGSVVSFRVPQAYCTPQGLSSVVEMGEWFRQVADHGAEHQCFFFGVGDHGGGIYEKQLQWLLEVSRDYDVVFSTLEEYFQVIEKLELPLVAGEHVHHSPGCYSAVGEVKRTMAEAEKMLFKAEKIVLENRFSDADASVAKLEQAWDGLLFNYFHDIYPGTSSRAAYQHEIRDITGATTQCARDVLEIALARLGSQVRTDFLTEGGVLVWNPLPYANTGMIGFDTFCDPNGHGRNFNSLINADGNVIPLQWLRGAAAFGPCAAAWGKTAAVAQLPASGVAAYAYHYTDQVFPMLGFERQREVLRRLSFPVLADVFDTWGHGAKRLGETVGEAALVRTEELADGPAASVLRCHYVWKNSTFQLDLTAWDGVEELAAHWHGDWNEAEETLKFAYRSEQECARILSGQAASVLARTPDECEQPFIDWVGLAAHGRCAGFFASGLHGYDSCGGTLLRLTLCRPVIYIEHAPFPPHGDEGYADLGWSEHFLWLFDAEIPTVARRAQCRLWEPEAMEITQAADGSKLCRDIWEVTPEAVVVTAQKRNPDGAVEFHLWNSGAEACEAAISRNGKPVRCESLPANAFRIVTF